MLKNSRGFFRAIVLFFIFVLWIGSQLLSTNVSEETFPILRGAYLGQEPPRERAKLFDPGIVSTCMQHSSAYYSPDGKEVYFSQMFPLPHVIMYIQEENGVWTNPKEGYPYVTVDGKYFFFYSNRVSVLNKNRIPDGPGNVYWIDAKIIEKLKPKDVK